MNAPGTKRSPLRGWVPATVALFVLWLILSDKRDVLHLAAGFLGAVGVIASLAFRGSKRDGRNPRALLLLGYLPWLLWQILRSNLHVTRLVLSRRPNIQPRFLRLPPALRDPQALTLLGTSITLTPGTLTVDIGAEEMIIHALDEGSAADIEARTMARRIAPLFDESSP
jgi:multicomponent Na+:H+ antiporter subunit E